MRGKLILIEGLDRSGKSTQAALLNQRIANSHLIKFPERSTPIGQIINKYLTDSSYDLSDQSAHLLFSANRWELAKDIISKLNNGEFVILDRYIYSGIAYSLAKSKVSNSSNEMNDYNWLYSPDKGLPKPDITLFLTLDLQELSNRKGWGEERYELKEFQIQVKSCFEKILPPNVNIINVNNLSIEQVEAEISIIVTNDLTNDDIHYFT
ncbi:thymidylate kinase [Hyphopichia burtonii NRRL Y-1933]|uniref:dTMP kinase n=1 Tax=Hyphopichia burtonii NRRL Y-1933 TaxID=984485 RepID=A0A1E4RRR3_9ASCO|nr:thymidylate kinase [Hyphopichia burtonii NRRL Y-1933]ODV69745.1 thymidylate kinase [Hyphopichia burtonii NRRL Y-1933]